MVYQYDVQIINRKYKSIIQRFGAQSSYAQEYTGKLLGMGAKPNKQGILQLPTYKKDIVRYNERSVFQENIAQMRKFISTQDIKKRVRQTLKAEGIAPEGERGQYTEQQITERVTLEGEIKDIIRDLQAVAYDNNENIKRILFGVDRGGTNRGNLTQADMELIKQFHSELEQNRTIVQYPFE
jgi:hypothetical protein